MKTNTRSRMVETGLTLFRKQGYAETSWRVLVKEAGTPWGSVQHSFPGGKEELAAAALNLFISNFAEFFETICAEYPRPADRIRVWFESMAKSESGNSYTGGCPVAGIALNSVPMNESLATLCRETLTRWTNFLAEKLTTEHISEEAARTLAIRVILAFEGALILSRVHQSDDGFAAATEWIVPLLEASDGGLEPQAGTSS